MSTKKNHKRCKKNKEEYIYVNDNQLGRRIVPKKKKNCRKRGGKRTALCSYREMMCNIIAFSRVHL